MAIDAAAAIGRAALGRAMSRKGRPWKLALILVAALALVPVLVLLSFFAAAMHVLGDLKVLPTVRLGIDAYRAAEECPFASSNGIGEAAGAAYLVASAYVLTGDWGLQYGGYRNNLGSLDSVPDALRPDPGELAPRGAVHDELGLPGDRTVRPQDWTTALGWTKTSAVGWVPTPVVDPQHPLGGQHGIGFLLIFPGDWESWVKEVPAGYAQGGHLDPYRPYDAFLVMACHLQALEKRAGQGLGGTLSALTGFGDEELVAILNWAIDRSLWTVTAPATLVSLVLGAFQAAAGSGSGNGTGFTCQVQNVMGQTCPMLGQAQPSAYGLASIPPDYLALIRYWADRYGLDWTVLAAVLEVQCDFGRCAQSGQAGAGATAQLTSATGATLDVRLAASANLSFGQIVGLVERDIPGVSAQTADVAAAIAEAESCGNPQAAGDAAYGGSYGLWQVNQPAHPGTMQQALTPDGAVQLMWQISSHGTNWSPWTTFRTGAYLQFLNSHGSCGGGGSTATVSALTSSSSYQSTMVQSTAKYLASLGAGHPGTLRSALCQYDAGSASSAQYQACMNGTQKPDYADTVMQYARRYRATGSVVTTAQITAGSSRAVDTAIAFAERQLGKPYVWGGTGSFGWDCSGLVQAAYAAAGIQLPRTSNEQYYHSGPQVGLPHEPGDLVFFTGSDGSVTEPGHVGIAINATQMIVAPKTGLDVQIQTIYSQGYVGATRPAA